MIRSTPTATCPPAGEPAATRCCRSGGLPTRSSTAPTSPPTSTTSSPTPRHASAQAGSSHLYYAALRPEEAVALRQEDLILPAHHHGKIIVTTACPRTGTAWTSTGTPHEPRGLKHRPLSAIRVVPIPPVLVRMLRRHLRQFGTTPDGRLFRGARGGMLSESVYGRAWHTARQAALGPELAATALARRPYDLRHAALSLWLNATGAPAEVAARAGNSTRVLHDVYLHCTNGQDDTISQRIEDVLAADTTVACSSRSVMANGSVHRRLRPDPVRHMSVNGRQVPRIAHGHTARQHRMPARRH